MIIGLNEDLKEFETHESNINFDLTEKTESNHHLIETTQSDDNTADCHN